MPIFVVNGKRYRVRFLSLLNGSEPITEDPLPSLRKVRSLYNVLFLDLRNDHANGRLRG